MDLTNERLNNLKENIEALCADELVDLKTDVDEQVLSKTMSKDALHKVIKKERKRPEACKVCESTHLVKNGKTKQGRQKYRCMDCGKSYSDTHNSIVKGSKKPYYVWEAFIQCMMNGFSLRKISSLIDITTQTAFSWRHKVMETLATYDQSYKLSEEIQIDETYFLLNMKGSRELPRPAKERGTKGRTRGISNEFACVLTAVDANDHILLEVIGQGNPRTGSIIGALDYRVEQNTRMITDSKAAYHEVSEHFSSKLHQIPSHSHTKGVYNLAVTNGLHSEMRSWFRKFKGVSTKHLARYLAWFRFEKLLRYRYEMKRHNRKCMNYAISNHLTFLTDAISKQPFPIDIELPYKQNQYFA